MYPATSFKVVVLWSQQLSFTSQRRLAAMLRDCACTLRTHQAIAVYHCLRAIVVEGEKTHPMGNARPAVWRPQLLLTDAKSSANDRSTEAAKAAAEMIPIIHKPKFTFCKHTHPFRCHLQVYIQLYNSLFQSSACCTGSGTRPSYICA